MIPTIIRAIQMRVFCNRNSSETSGLIRLAKPNNSEKKPTNSEKMRITIFIKYDSRIIGNFIILILIDCAL